MQLGAVSEMRGGGSWEEYDKFTSVQSDVQVV